MKPELVYVNDTREVVTYSVMLYYTPEVEAKVDDLDGFFDTLICETNQGTGLICIHHHHYHNFRISTEWHTCTYSQILH